MEHRNHDQLANALERRLGTALLNRETAALSLSLIRCLADGLPIDGSDITRIGDAPDSAELEKLAPRGPAPVHIDTLGLTSISAI